MTRKLKKYILLIITSVSFFALMSFSGKSLNDSDIKFPYKEAGLTEREAAAHLLNRFTFGPKQNQVDEVVKQGLENWFLQQLEANLNDNELNTFLEPYDAINMTNDEIEKHFPANAKVKKMAIDDGFMSDAALAEGKEDKKEKMAEYRKMKGLRAQKDLNSQLFSQKIIRATFSQNQLREVLTDFWFNHFNVSITKNSCETFIMSYERDVIRKNCLTNFEQLLVSTAKSPAMLEYLDNAKSTGKNSRFGGTKSDIERRVAKLENDTSAAARNTTEKLKRQLSSGLNENYARELMELHTLGVEGGYTQKDVTEAARVLTGWTVFPKAKDDNPQRLKKIEQLDDENARKQGFVREGDFFFAINRHDDEEKTVLGKKFPAGGEYEEGLELLHILATHPSTAKFICKKLAVHFVSDNPPQSLIDRMAKTFLEKKGDIKQILLTMVQSPEFWSKDAVREKIKSPFELAISSVRILNAQSMLRPDVLNKWITKMGQRMYFYAAPTGFPDNAQYWINTGSLLNRINFGLAVTSNRIPGLSIDLAALNDYKEPDSPENALKVYCSLLLPERNSDATIKRLLPLLNTPELENKIDKAAGDKTDDSHTTTADNQVAQKKNTDNLKQSLNFSNSSGLSQVAGIIIGSPEFQRR